MGDDDVAVQIAQVRLDAPTSCPRGGERRQCVLFGSLEPQPAVTDNFHESGIDRCAASLDRVGPETVSAQAAPLSHRSDDVSSRSAWIVPTHEPHFEFAAQLMASIVEFDIPVDPYLVFSCHADMALFSRQYDVRWQAIVLTDHATTEQIAGYEQQRSIINVKKFVGLWQLHKQYNHLFTLDSEAICLGSGDPRLSFGIREERKSWPAQCHDDPMIRGIVKACTELFDLRDRSRLVDDVLAGGRLYSWFEDIPGFRADDVAAFFAYFGATSDVTVLCGALRWEHFDHLVYQLFCCLRRGWTLCDLAWPSPQEASATWEKWTTAGSSAHALAQEFSATWAPSWVSDVTVCSTMPAAFMTFHRDR